MRWRSTTLAVSCLLLAACSSGKESTSPTIATAGTATATSSRPAATTSTTASPAASGNLTLTVTGVRLVNSEESDNALRILLDSAAAEVSVTLGAGVPSPNRTINVCPSAAPGQRVPGVLCRTPASGEAVMVPHGTAYPGVDVVQLGVAATGAAANSTAISEITVTWPGRSRALTIRLPSLVQGESGGRPSFRLLPAGPGNYRASATWTSGGGGTGEAELELDAGLTSVSRAQGAPGIQVNGNLSPPGEATLRFRNAGSSVLLQPTITALFP